MSTPREYIVAAMNRHLQAAQAAAGAYADIRARCAAAGLDFDQVSVEHAGRTSWDDGEVVVGADGTVVKCIDPFDAREGPAALLADL